jgi:PAS domain S-box-containing protein
LPLVQSPPFTRPFSAVPQRTQKTRGGIDNGTQFRDVADHAPVMIWVTGPDGSCTYLSNLWYEFTGQDPATALGFGWLDVTHPEDRPAAEKAFLEANEARAPFRLDYRLRRHDGVYRWAIDSAAPRFGPGGEFLGYVGSVIDITERKQAEELLRESEAQLAAEAQALLSLHTVSSRLWQMRDLRGGLEEMLGVTLGMLGADMGTVQVVTPTRLLVIAAQQGFSPHVLESFREIPTDGDSPWARALRSGERWVVADVESGDAPHAPFRDIARSAGYQAVQSTPLLSRSGTPLGMISTYWRRPHAPTVPELRRLDLYARQAADFIERSQIDETLRQAQQRFDIVRDSTQVGFWFCDLPFDTLAWDSRVKEHFWLQPDAEVTIDTFYERLHPDDREPTRRAIEASIAQKSNYEIDYRTVSPTGQVKWIRAMGRGFYNRNGEPFRFDGVTLDITERKEAEENLRIHRELLETVVRYVDIGAALVRGSDLRYQIVNEAYQAISPGRKIVGQTVGEAWPETQPQFGERCRTVLETGVPYAAVDERFQIRRTPNGSLEEAYFSWSIHRVRLPGDDGWGLLLSTADTTDRKRVENALRDAHALLTDKASHLESLVQQRTARLREIIGELEAFSYSIAHDMRAPLRSLQGFSDALSSDYADKIDAEGQSYLRRISKSAARMDQLIQDVLSYSRVVRGEWPFEPVDVAQLLQGIADTYPMLAPEKADILLEGTFPKVLGSEAMLMQIFSNLLGNAVKFVPPGTRPRIRVWAETKDERVRVFVRDNGIGIAPEEHEKIFRIFHQVGKKNEGTGIGLAIVKKAVERMNGTVSVDSQLGLGTTFCVEVQRG